MKVADRVLLGERRKLDKLYPKLFPLLGLTPDPERPASAYTAATWVGRSPRFDCGLQVHPITYAETEQRHINPWLACCLNRDHAKPKPDGWVGHYDDAYHAIDAARFTGKCNCSVGTRATAAQIIIQWTQHIIEIQHPYSENCDRSRAVWTEMGLDWRAAVYGPDTAA